MGVHVFPILNLGQFLKSLWNLLHSRFCFKFCFFDCEAHGIFAPPPGVEAAPLALEEGQVLTTGPPRRAPKFSFFQNIPSTQVGFRDPRGEESRTA